MAQSTAPLAVADPPEAEEPDAQAAALQLLADKINAVLDNGDFVPQREAARLHKEFLEHHAEDLALILHAHSYTLIYQKLRAAMDSRRLYNRSLPKRMGDAAHAGEDLSVFTAYHFRIDEDNTQRPAGKMTGENWGFSAAETETEEMEAAKIKAWKRAMEKTVPTRKATEDVMTEDQFVAFRKKFLG